MAFRPRRQARRDVLIKEGFAKFEARALSSEFLSSPVIKLARKARRDRQRDWNKQGLSQAARRRDVAKLYTTNKWLIDPTKSKTRKGIAGQADPWALFRATRQKAIDSGEYIPPKRPKKVRKGLDRDQIKSKRPTGPAPRIEKRSDTSEFIRQRTEEARRRRKQ